MQLGTAQHGNARSATKYRGAPVLSYDDDA